MTNGDGPMDIKTVWFPEFEAGLPRLDGKVVAITGCTTGTGYVAAQTCLRKGAHVVMLNRKSERVDAAVKSLAQEVPGAKLTAIECNLADFDSVRSAAAVLNTQFADTGIDVICNNAGVMALADQATKEGYDIQMQTNHLAHFLLNKLTFPLLEKAAAARGEARIVNHSSGARMTPSGRLQAKFLEKNGGNLGGNTGASFFGIMMTMMGLSGGRWVRYKMTKLANSVYTVVLDKKLRAMQSKVKAMVVTPGLAATNLQVTTAHDGGLGSTQPWFMRFGQSAEDGTMPLLQAMVGAGVESGAYFEPKDTAKGPATAKKLGKWDLDGPSGEMLWAKSEDACGKWDLGSA